MEVKVRITWIETRKWNPIVFEPDTNVMSLLTLVVTEVSDHHNSTSRLLIDSHVALHAHLVMNALVRLAELVENH